MTIRFLAQVPSGYQVTASVQPFKFPAGEWHLKNTDADEKPIGAVVYGTDPEDLVILGMWADYVHQRGEKAVAYIPYFPAARADRGVPFGAKVYADIVNSFNLDEVVIFDPHSPVIVELINNVRVIDSAPVIKSVIDKHGEGQYVGVIAPDKGAVARATQAADALGVPLYKATKERDFETGHLSKFAIEELPAEGRLLVADDICEGGRSFTGLSEASGVSRDRMSLWVSHGSFTGNAGQLPKYFSRIYTTDSLPGAHREDVGAIVTPILPELLTR